MKNYWSLAFGISFLAHSIILTVGAFMPFARNIISDNKKQTKEVKITVKEVHRKETSASRLQDSKTGTLQLPPPPYIQNVVRKLMGEDKERPVIGKAQILEKNTDKIIISEKLENSKLKSNPSYMSYYKGIRSKLNAVCQNNYTGKERGEVVVSFVLSRDGRLESVKGEGNNKELINVAVESVKEAFPFMPFPPDLPGPTCPFEVSILFKNN